jgi:hypothetical protein
VALDSLHCWRSWTHSRSRRLMTASVRLPRPSTRPHRGRADRRDRRRPHERTDTRLARRNGHRSRLLTTTAGELELRIPKLRAGSFFPSLLERRRRVDQALFAVVMEAYLHGVSTRKVDDLVRAWGPTAASAKARSAGSALTSIARSAPSGTDRWPARASPTSLSMRPTARPGSTAGSSPQRWSCHRGVRRRAPRGAGLGRR